ncbi:MAG: hypothetical protein ACJ8BW_29795 [Ktedonobacteraceae bacterium]
MDIYSHVLPTIQQETIDKLNRAFMDDDEGEDGAAGGVPARKK